MYYQNYEDYMRQILGYLINYPNIYEIYDYGIVLFSPASASFDMFKNFEERGEMFKKLVQNIEE